MSSAAVTWPHGFATLFHKAVPEDLLERLQQEASAIAECDNFWISHADLEGKSTKTTWEDAIWHIMESILRSKLPTKWAGAEWWVQVYEPGKGLAFHFDKDEHAMKEKQQIIQPILSSVLYLTGDSTHERLGPTAVVDQHFEAEQGKPVPDSPERTALIFPCRNQYVLFDGRLGHGVLGSSSKQPRMTMLINWWADKPQELSRIPDEVISHHSLSGSSLVSSACGAQPLDLGQINTNLPSRMQHLNITLDHGSDSKSTSAPATNSHHANGSTSNQTAQRPLQSADTSKSPSQNSHEPSQFSFEPSQQQTAKDTSSSHHAASEPTVSASGDGLSSSQHAGSVPAGKQLANEELRQVSVPCVSIAGWDESPVSVDDVLQTYGLDLVGPKAIHAVAIDHRGFELFPLDEENLEANAGNIVTAAAFVPAGLVSDQSDSSSRSDE